jgi:hypothetical protein
MEVARLRGTAAISSILALLLCLSSVCFPVRCQTPQASGSVSTEPAVLSGKVRDLHGTPVARVQVTLVGQGEAVHPVATTDAEGAFLFPQIAPGTYRVKVNAPGSAPWTSDEIVLGPGERREVPISSMGRPTTRTTVQVAATLNEVAQAQV